ncbi:MAG: type I phosphomannose isomerase catalytic subunit [Solirubrobacterales bacterium]
MYPLKFKSIYQTKIWGGNKFKSFRRDTPKGLIGESWDLCFRNDAVSTVANGRYRGVDLGKLANVYCNEILGSHFKDKPFPLLIKIINAEDDLSLQVHPGNEFAGIHEKEPGKSEFWYVMDCEPGACVVLGVNSSSVEEFKKCISKEHIDNEELDKYLNKIIVKPGDFFYVKSGLIHGIGKGILLAEIQDNSNLTYRLCDYGRGRKVEIEKAFAVSDFSAENSNMDISHNESDSMSLNILDINDVFVTTCSKERFHTLTCVFGHGFIRYEGGIENINYGDSILIPASIGKYEIMGSLKLIRVDLK